MTSDDLFRQGSSTANVFLMIDKTRRAVELSFKKEIDFLRVSCLFFVRSAAWKQSYSF